MNAYQDFLKAAELLTNAQLAALVKGVKGVRKYIEGDYIGVHDDTTLLVAAVPSSGQIALTLNAMAYLSNFCPASDRRFPRLYRIHDFEHVPKYKPGMSVTIKPFRSFLSWSASPTISVEGTSNLAKEGLLSIDDLTAKVIFSYKVTNTLARGSKSKSSPAYSPRIYSLIGALNSLLVAASKYAREKEVVVYHPKPFKAKVARVLVSDDLVKEAIASMGLTEYLGQGTKIKDGLLCPVTDRKALIEMLDRKLRKSVTRLTTWLGESQLFQLHRKEGKTFLAITNLRR